MKKKLIFNLALLVLFLLPMSGCNFFGWIYSAEKSDDYELVYSEAEAKYRMGNFEKGLALFQRAVEIRSNSAEALYGCIKARLMLATDGQAITYFFAEIFQTNQPPLSFLTNLESLNIVDLQNNIQRSYENLLLINDTNFSDKSLNKQSISFLSDSIFIHTTAALLQLNDSNTNGIPHEIEDLFLIKEDLTISTSNTNLGNNAITNLLTILSNSNLTLSNSENLLISLESKAPNFFTPSSPWTALRYNTTNSAKNIQEAILIYEGAL